METLKSLLISNNISQRKLADNISISPAAINLFINKGVCPKWLPRESINRRITKYLVEMSIDEKIIEKLLTDLHLKEYMDNPLLSERLNLNDQNPEEDLMLLRKQTLT